MRQFAQLGVLLFRRGHVEEMLELTVPILHSRRRGRALGDVAPQQRRQIHHIIAFLARRFQDFQKGNQAILLNVTEKVI